VDPDKASKTQEMVYEMKVGDVMTREVITVRPTTRLSELRGLLQQNRISGLPVVDEERLVGLVSVEDFIKWLADRQDDCPIEQRMTKKLETLNRDDPLVLAIGKFEKTGLGRFPVLDRRTRKLVGILTKGDVIEGLLKRLEIDYHEEEIHRYRASHIFEDIEADNTTLLFQYDVRGQDFKEAGTSSSRLKRTLKRLGIRPDVVRRVAIAGYEAEMNLVVFTERGTIRAKVQPTHVFLEVEDAGPGIADLEKALRPGYSTAPEWVRELGFGAGMGLTNIQKSANSFEIQSEPGKGTLLKVTFCTGEGNGEAG
jgi:CBS domain-containing protein/anti-sigma regulatory factor (Ser/Thr protein kinase)